MVKRSFILSVVALFVVTMGLIVFLIQNKPAKYEGPFEELSFGNSPTVFFSLLPLIAEEQGFFTQNGLHVHIKDFEYGALAVDDVMKGHLDIAVAADFAFISKSFDRDDLRIVASLGTSASEEIVAFGNMLKQKCGEALESKVTAIWSGFSMQTSACERCSQPFWTIRGCQLKLIHS